MKNLFFLLFFISEYSFGQHSKPDITSYGLNKIAVEYVRLGLAIGQYDNDFVDAYFGPDSLKPKTAKQAVFPKDSFLQAANYLQVQLQPFVTRSKDAVLSTRAKWISSQLIAFSCRIKMYAGEKISFDEQAKELFGVELPTEIEDNSRSMLQQLDKILPGVGSVTTRFELLASRFVIPKEKLDTVIRTAIAESKKRTQKYLQLPPSEDFRLEYVTGKPWGGYNWYLGNYKSLMQFNTDASLIIDRKLQVASHEGYPGHHVYHCLQEKNLYKDKGWIEVSLYPLFSPHSLLSEGSANYGVDLAFPKQEKIEFIKEHLLLLAGLDTSGLPTYFQALAIKSELYHLYIDICRKFVDGKIADAEVIRWLIDYGLVNEKDAARNLSFIKKYESYVINYYYGKDLVKNYIESNGGTENNPAKRWALFKWLLSNEVTPADLMLKAK